MDPASFAASVATLAVAALTFVLTLALPGRVVNEYALARDGTPRPATLNGLAVLATTVAAAAAAVRAGVAPATLFADGFAAAAATAAALGLAAAAAAYAAGAAALARDADAFDRSPVAAVAGAAGAAGATRGRTAARGSGRADTSEFDSRGPLGHFYAGLGDFNPRLLGVHVKMWLYVAGAAQLLLNVLSLLAAHVAARGSGAAGGLPLPAALGGGSASLAAAAWAGCMAFFVVEYVYHEEVHLWTYDLFRERVGFKLLWGCLCFYPWAYAAAGLAAVAAPRADVPPAAAAAAAATFLAGWVLTRGANLQKHAAKTRARAFACCGVRVPLEYVPGSGERLLASGFWGLARHVNYLGEIVQAAAAVAPLAWAAATPLPLLYPAYYIALFLPRAADDDAICEKKYGKAWAEYVRRVPARIVPGLY